MPGAVAAVRLLGEGGKPTENPAPIPTMQAKGRKNEVTDAQME